MTGKTNGAASVDLRNVGGGGKCTSKPGGALERLPCEEAEVVCEIVADGGGAEEGAAEGQDGSGGGGGSKRTEGSGAVPEEDSSVDGTVPGIS